MAFSLSVAITATAEHATASDGTFSAAGATAWNGTGAHSVAGSGTLSVVDATSGGVPYFSSTTAIGTSALLASGGVVIGGGAGAAPSTTNITVTSSGNILNVPGNASQTVPVIMAKDNPSNPTGINFGTVTFAVGIVSNSTLAADFTSVFATTYVATGAPNMAVRSGGIYAWSNDASNPHQTKDTSLSRISAGVIGAGTGAQGEVDGTFRGLYQSSDGTAGATAGPFTVITSIEVKNGLVVTLTGS